jgi:putative spermidine/putrescine transport system permease protein
VKPSLIAGSILTFSLSLGDYITIQLVGGKTQTIGNVVYANFGAPNLLFATAFAVVPVVIIVIYLLMVRRTGAFEDL